MNTTAFFASPKTLRRIHVGPLGSYVDDFATLLEEQLYSQSSAQGIIRNVAKWSRWLYGHHVEARDVDAVLLEQYLTHLVRIGSLGHEVRPALYKMLTWLQSRSVAQAVSPPIISGQSEIELNNFARYLSQERGLSATTLRCYLPYISQFMTERFGDNPIEFEALVAEDITGFVQRNSQCLSHFSVQHLITALRCFLNYLRLMGRISIDLAFCVPMVANFSFSTLPNCLRPDQIEQVLSLCDQSTAKGLRDYAILLLLARLGLRAGEVIALKLDDISWEQGYLTIRRKGGRFTRLPILNDVGNAIANYLTSGRPTCHDRHVFIRETAPRTGMSDASSVSALVMSALLRAGIESVRKGAHLFRHSLATNMLRKGASFKEIGEVLGHRNQYTTQLYAKVDLSSLERLALPWPRGGE